ncbi:MAG TPA: succinate dehydrogenase, hydrophobic membrane anchor protein [Holosporales bacterium]|nr:succinate dehydrogenase, hydrophobic membrane anchor protein [Holosporales bacterium]
MTSATHWKHQRISAILLLFLLPWFFFGHNFSNPYSCAESFSSVWALTGLTLLALSLLYHFTLGVITVVEDYISSLKWRSVLVNMAYLLAFVLCVFIFICIIKIAANGAILK